MKAFPLVIATIFGLASCGSKQEAAPAPQYTPTPLTAETKIAARAVDETAAAAVFDTARLAFHAGGYETAARLARSVRQRYPAALNAREDAILLIDSIEMAEAAVRVARLDATGCVDTDEGVAVERAKAADKVAYYQQKLARDLQARKRHG